MGCHKIICRTAVISKSVADMGLYHTVMCFVRNGNDLFIKIIGSIIISVAGSQHYILPVCLYQKPVISQFLGDTDSLHHMGQPVFNTIRHRKTFIIIVITVHINMCQMILVAVCFTPIQQLLTDFNIFFNNPNLIPASQQNHIGKQFNFKFRLIIRHKFSALFRIIFCCLLIAIAHINSGNQVIIHIILFLFQFPGFQLSQTVA